jgi:gamma-butyrobetaine dioxygenase
MSEASRDPVMWLDLPALYTTRGRRRYDEAVTQEEHALQCAALARAGRADDELVLAALLHDVGHLIRPGESALRRSAAETPADHHGIHGAALLRAWLPERIAWLIEHHVVAKRYLCAVDATYRARLSPASVSSLAVQGGALPPAECRALEGHRWFADAVRIRRWDDAAKAPAARVAGWETYVPLLDRHVGRAPVAS